MTDTMRMTLTNNDGDDVYVEIEFDVVGHKKIERKRIYVAIGEPGPDITYSFDDDELRWADGQIIRRTVWNDERERDIDRPDYAPPREK